MFFCLEKLLDQGSDLTAFLVKIIVHFTKSIQAEAPASLYQSAVEQIQYLIATD